MAPLLEVTDLSLSIRLNKEIVPVLRSISFCVAPGEIVAIVGETGSGKSLLALTLMGLVPTPPFLSPSGSIRMLGNEVLAESTGLRPILSRRSMAMIFQQPRAALNPVFPIGEQLIETAMIHFEKDRMLAHERTKQALRDVQLSGDAGLLRKYPHELSGGMLQRIMVAMALLCNPELLLADEPTTALDASIQREILDLLAKLSRERNMGLILISHDLHLVRAYSHKILVLYAGEIVEMGASESVFSQPDHPYTQGLLRSTPSVPLRLKKIPTIAGSAPGLKERPQGCPFHPRCASALHPCKQEMPPSFVVGQEKQVRCWLFDPMLGGLADADTPL